VQAVGEERDKDVRFDAVLCLMENGSDGQIAFDPSSTVCFKNVRCFR
jgi:hypothetical protein